MRNVIVAFLGTIAIVTRTDLVSIRARTQPADPCATVSSTALSGAGREAPAEAKAPTHHAHGAPRYLDALWNHRARIGRAGAAAASALAGAVDVGDIAVLQDAGDLVLKPNPFDLSDVGVRLSPNSAGGYDLARGSYGFRQPLGSALTFADDDSRADTLRFAFPFYGREQRQVFINSDGNLTFEEADAASTVRSVSRLLSGPPRIAALFADLDPSAAGRVLISSGLDAYSVTWCGVREYGTQRAATAQVTLLPSGVIELQVSNRTTLRDAIVAVSPGRTTSFVPVDLTGAGVSAGPEAIGERFTTASDLDTVSTLRRFFTTHGDDFDNVVLFTDAELLTSAFAYELTIANDIRGLNIDSFDASAEWGSGGQLHSVVVMDALGKYPDDPHEKVLGENSTVSILGQEFGHRWAAFLTFRDQTGRASRQLLGRDNAHWSFFFDSDASVLEGNDIEDLGGGAFRTSDAVNRYSLLDQYAMGLVDKSAVPPFFYVQNPTNVTPPSGSGSAPRIGVTFSGTRRDVTIDDVIAVVGERVPSAADSPREYRQAFIYVVSMGRDADPREIAKLDRIRIAWDQFLSAATESRMRVETRLGASR